VVPITLSPVGIPRAVAAVRHRSAPGPPHDQRGAGWSRSRVSGPAPRRTRGGPCWD